MSSGGSSGGHRNSLEIRGLRKAYRKGPVALDGIDLDIPPGVFGLLGPNGAGKSTLMRIVATLQRADSGTVRLGEVDALKSPRAMRRILGYLPQDFGLPPNASAEGLLDHLAELKGLIHYRERSQAVRSLLERTNLWQFRRRKVGTFSGGMRQRFGIAQALLAKPRLVIVDEPTSGLDPEERARFFDALAEVGEEVVVILSTHLVDDVEQFASRLAILDRGKLRFVGSPTQALAGLAGRIGVIDVRVDEADEVAERFTVIRSRRFMGRMELRMWAPDGLPSGARSSSPDLEDFYFAALRGLETESPGLGSPAAGTLAAGNHRKLPNPPPSLDTSASPTASMGAKP